jgi:hypothetical protein
MKYIYLFIAFSCSSLLAQQSAIKRAALTLGSQTSENGEYMVQQSVGFSGPMQTQKPLPKKACIWWLLLAKPAETKRTACSKKAANSRQTY